MSDEKPTTWPGGSVYFIQAEHGGPVKIGCTTEPVLTRLSKVQTGNPERLVVRNVIPCQTAAEARALEKELHQRLAEDRLYREWFIPSVQVAVYAHVDAEGEAPDAMTVDRWASIAQLWANGADRAYIASLLGWPLFALKREMTRMRQYGYKLPHAIKDRNPEADAEPVHATPVRKPRHAITVFK